MNKIQSVSTQFMRVLTIVGMLCLHLTVWAQGQTIKGQVVDSATGEPLVGVAIQQQGSQNGVITDLDGNFQLQVPASAKVLFSYVGYEKLELSASEAKGTIRLREDKQLLSEVVVVGYGTQKKVNLSGAVSAIEGDVIAQKPATDVLSALQGEMPGVMVLRSSGQPGSETSGMRVRGFSSVNATQTLVLIDGVEGDMTLLNPSDIESISVLKDAAASAIYGARAAAGVVLITTKNGKSGKAKLSYNGYVAVNTPGNMPKRLPAWEEQDWINEGRLNADGKVEWSPEQSSWVHNANFNYRPNNTNSRWDFFEATNWVDEGTRDQMFQQSHALSVSGGTKQMNYLVSGNYYTKQGILKYGPDNNERITLRAKMNAELSKYVDLSIQANYEGKFVETNPNGATWILNRLYRVRGRQPIMNPEEDITDNPYNGDLQVNPIQMMKEGGKNTNSYQAYTGKVELTIKNLVDGLRLKLSANRKAGYYNLNSYSRTLLWYNRLGTGTRQTANTPNSMTRTKNEALQDQLEAILTYDKKIKKHEFNVLAGASFEQYRKDEMSATAKNMNSNDFFSFNFYNSADATNTSISDLVQTWAMGSYFGRINYNYAERYLLEANIRVDGSSRLAPDYRWESFPSFSGAWRISEEPWFKVPVISNLKVRGSWGQLGNGAILGLYDYLAVLNSGTNMGEKYYYQGSMASETKTWEVITSKDIGIDLSMWDNKFSLTADYYWKENDNMLANLELPSVVGMSVPQSNVGTLKSWGWEVEASYRNSWHGLDYKVSFNLSSNDNEVTSYDGANAVSAGVVGVLEGYPLNTIWGYKTDGYWSSRDEYLAYKEAHPGYQSFNDSKVSGGDVKYLAQGTPDHTIGAGNGKPGDSGDLVNLGTTNAKYLYGFNLNLAYKGFDFAVMFQGAAQRKVYIAPNVIAPFATTSEMPWTIYRDYWTPENPDAKWPRLYNYNGNQFNFQCSDKWLQDGSYLRLKNIQLGYTLPLQKLHIDKCRIYVAGQDVWEHTNMMSVYDPEAGNQTSSNYYPFFRTWTVGLNVTF